MKLSISEQGLTFIQNLKNEAEWEKSEKKSNRGNFLLSNIIESSPVYNRSPTRKPTIHNSISMNKRSDVRFIRRQGIAFSTPRVNDPAGQKSK